MSGDFASSKAAIAKAYADAQALIQKQRGQTYQKYGYDTDGNLDPTQKYGLYQRNEHDYQSGQNDLSLQREQFASRYGITMDGNGGYTTDPNGNGQLQQLQTQRNRLQSQSGLTANDASNPTSLTISDNPAGQYQRMIAGQAQNLRSMDNAVHARGLGGKGIGAQAIGNQAQADAFDRGDYKTGILNALQDSSSQEKGLTTDIGFGLKGFANQSSNLDYSHGANQQDIVNGLLGDINGLDQQGLNATYNYNSSMTQAMTNEAMARAFDNAGASGAQGGGSSVGGNPNIFTPQTMPIAQRILANKSGASANKRQGIFSIH